MNPQSRWPLRLITTGVWGLAVASVAYWGLKLGGAPAAPMVAVVSSAMTAPVDSLKVARLLGATDAPVAAAPVVAVSSRFTLVGVVAGASGRGTALIGVDGKPPKPFPVGTEVDPGLVLQSVRPRVAVMGSSTGAAAVTLEMPKPGAVSGPSISISGPGMAPAPARFIPPAAASPLPVAPPVQPQQSGVQSGSRSNLSTGLGGKRDRDGPRSGGTSQQPAVQ